jgi:hypothetical protein
MQIRTDVGEFRGWMIGGKGCAREKPDFGVGESYPEAKESPTPSRVVPFAQKERREVVNCMIGRRMGIYAKSCQISRGTSATPK